MHRSLAVDEEIGPYRIRSFVARGGMAVVYCAEDVRLGRRVALKLLAPELSDNEDFHRRFVGESQMAAAIDHPNIIPIYEAGAMEGILYIAMRYVDGSDLRALMERSGPLDMATIVPLFEQVAAALDAAHASGLVHRDVKPDNILIAPSGEDGTVDHVYLTDFGLTKRAASLSGLTTVGHFIGTIDYIAPEQVTGAAVDARTDVYAMGCVLFEALTGTVPFVRDSQAAVIYAHLSDPPPLATGRRPGLPAAADGVLARAMAKRPEDRYPSCLDVIDDLRATVPVQLRHATTVRQTVTPVPLQSSTGNRWSGSHSLSPGLRRETPANEVTTARQTVPASPTGKPSPLIHQRRFLRDRRFQGGLAALVAVLVVLTTAGVLRLLSPASTGRSVVLPFLPERYPAAGITVTRTWTLSGSDGDHLQGDLSVEASKRERSSFVEVLPKQMVESTSDVEFHPSPTVIKSDPIVSYKTPPGPDGSLRLQYDVAVSAGPLLLDRLTKWAKAQKDRLEAYLLSIGRKPPVTLRTLGVEPSVLTLTVGDQPRQVHLTGTYNERPAVTAELNKAVFDVADSRIAVTSTHGAVTPVSAGTTTVTAHLGALSATVTVNVAPADTASPSSSSTAGTDSPAPTETSPSTGETTGDTTDPVIDIRTPSSEARYPEGEQVSADYTCTDDSGTPSCVGDVPNGGFIDTTVGRHVFKVVAVDAAGNMKDETISYSVDADLSPHVTVVVIITTPAEGAPYTQGERVIADYRCVTDGSPSPHCDGPVPNGQPIDTASVGPKKFTVTARDAAGNIRGNEERNYTVGAKPDTTPPTVDISRPADDAAFMQDESVTAEYSCADAESDCTATATVDGGTTISNGEAIPTSVVGSHIFTVTAVDTAGNPAEPKSVSYSVSAPAASPSPTPTPTTMANPAGVLVGSGGLGAALALRRRRRRY